MPETRRPHSVPIHRIHHVLLVILSRWLRSMIMVFDDDHFDSNKIDDHKFWQQWLCLSTDGFDFVCEEVTWDLERQKVRRSPLLRNQQAPSQSFQQFLILPRRTVMIYFDLYNYWYCLNLLKMLKSFKVGWSRLAVCGAKKRLDWISSTSEVWAISFLQNT